MWPGLKPHRYVKSLSQWEPYGYIYYQGKPSLIRRDRTWQFQEYPASIRYIPNMVPPSQQTPQCPTEFPTSEWVTPEFEPCSWKWLKSVLLNQ